MGKLADALNFEKAFTIEGVTFKVRRLSISDILRCAISGIMESECVTEERAYEMAEDLISGEQIVFPKAGIIHVMAKSSEDLDIKDAEALAVIDEKKSRNVCRFALGLPELSESDKQDQKESDKKKALKSIGWKLIQSSVSILANRFRK